MADLNLLKKTQLSVEQTFYREYPSQVSQFRFQGVLETSANPCTHGLGKSPFDFDPFGDAVEAIKKSTRKIASALRPTR